MKKRKFKQAPHRRRSKKGKVFKAGRGTRKRKSRLEELVKPKRGRPQKSKRVTEANISRVEAKKEKERREEARRIAQLEAARNKELRMAELEQLKEAAAVLDDYYDGMQQDISNAAYAKQVSSVDVFEREKTEEMIRIAERKESLSGIGIELQRVNAELRDAKNKITEREEREKVRKARRALWDLQDEEKRKRRAYERKFLIPPSDELDEVEPLLGSAPLLGSLT